MVGVVRKVREISDVIDRVLGRAIAVHISVICIVTNPIRVAQLGVGHDVRLLGIRRGINVLLHRQNFFGPFGLVDEGEGEVLRGTSTDQPVEQ